MGLLEKGMDSGNKLMEFLSMGDVLQIDFIADTDNNTKLYLGTDNHFSYILTDIKERNYLSTDIYFYEGSADFYEDQSDNAD